MIHPNDVPRWRAKLEQIEAAVAEDAAVLQVWDALDALRPERNAEARVMLADLESSRDFHAFRAASDS